MLNIRKTLFLFLAASALSVSLFIYFSNPPSYSVMDKLRIQGASILEELEKYRSVHGKYPATLQQANIDIVDNDYGGWKYVLENEGKTFVLSTGDYGKYLFELYWSSARGEWYLDR